MASTTANCATRWKALRDKLLDVPDVSKIELLGVQDEQIYIEFSMEELANLGIDRSALLAALQAQNAIRPAGRSRRMTSPSRSASRAPSSPSRTSPDVNFAVGGRMLRLADIATVRRGFSDPPQPLFRVNGEPAIGLAIAMRDGGDILALGENITRVMNDAKAELPLGIEPILVADQAVTVESAISEFMESLWQAVAIILVVSFLSLGVRPGLVIATAIPLTLAIVFVVMDFASIDMQRISLGALIIALALLVDDAMTTTDAMLTRLGEGDDKMSAATFAYRTYAYAMLAGTFVTMAGFVPVGFAASSAGEYTFSLFAVVSIALVVSWFVAVVFAPLLGIVILKPPKKKRGRPRLRVPRLSRLPVGGDQGQISHHRRHHWPVHRLHPGDAADPAAVLPVLRPAGTAGRPQPAAELSIYASRESAVERFDALLKDDPDVERWSELCGARRHPLLPAAQRAAAQRLLQPGGDRGEGRGGARPAAEEAGGGAGQATSPMR